MAIEFPTDTARRLPVYLLLDTSSSMQGVKIVGVNNGVTLIYQELMNDPRSASTVYISVITFASQAYQIPLMPITQFTPPQLSANGTTALGGALNILNQSLDQDLIANQPGAKGDYKPLVFLLTDGQPTDHWQNEAQRLHSRTTSRTVNVIGLGIGDDADMSTLQQICTSVLHMNNASPENIRAFFAWVSDSIKTASRAVQAPGEAHQAQLPPVPGGIQVTL